MNTLLWLTANNEHLRNKCFWSGISNIITPPNESFNMLLWPRSPQKHFLLVFLKRFTFCKLQDIVFVSNCFCLHFWSQICVLSSMLLIRFLIQNKWRPYCFKAFDQTCSFLRVVTAVDPTYISFMCSFRVCVNAPFLYPPSSPPLDSLLSPYENK